MCFAKKIMIFTKFEKKNQKIFFFGLFTFHNAERI